MTTSTSTELTAVDIRALKKSRSVAFHARWQDGELTESRIIGRDRDAADDDYTVAQLEVPSTLSFGGAMIRQNPDVRAFEHIGSAQFHEHWATIVSLLRAGDRLTLFWNANGGRNGITKRAGLAVDELSVRIVRGNRQLHFHIDSHVSEYNSARMFTLGDTFSPVTSDRNTDLAL
jgi:hypothetical protein